VDTPVLSTNKADRHNITEISLKVALNTITPISVFYIRINNLQSRKVETTRTTIVHLNRCLSVTCDRSVVFTGYSGVHQ
jgi:hypothetical protein